ncbi:hypothetical protein PIB30_043490 [Stylosanthes scabra]|uniref:Zinc knuckle CX2CX4HX4C domain-containing protein n=1 Tax=Stylosanthes scabra TaxID=79078 RepID=A0ABU6QF87_9FABA|nr:hypothetical protein [Stylosanthes scabra]
MGEVKECALFEAGKDHDRFLKATVKMKIDTPFRKGIHIGSKENGLTWVDFSYEYLATCYYTCGKMGHEEKTCGSAEKDEKDGKNNSKELGPWLKAEFIGKKVEHGNSQPRRTSRGNEEQEKKRKEKLTEKLMDKLANLSMLDSRKSDVGKGTSQPPATTSMGIFSHRRDPGIVDKKWNEVQELQFELENQEPEIFKKQQVKEGDVPIEEDVSKSKGKEVIVINQPNNKHVEEQKNPKQITVYEKKKNNRGQKMEEAIKRIIHTIGGKI